MTLSKTQHFLLALFFISLAVISASSASAATPPQAMNPGLKAYRKLLHSHRSYHIHHDKVKNLWETITGTLYEEKKPQELIPTTLPDNYHGQLKEEILASPDHSTVMISRGSHNQNQMLQDEKRLVPGGPDPLHHTSQPISP